MVMQPWGVRFKRPGNSKPLFFFFKTTPLAKRNQKKDLYNSLKFYLY